VSNGSSTPGTIAQQNRFLEMLRADVKVDDVAVNPYILFFDGIKPTMRCGMSGLDERPRTGIYFQAGQPSQARYFEDDPKAEFPP
jgi:hypothetical protein